jgi:hypothetical protein
MKKRRDFGIKTSRVFRDEEIEYGSYFWEKNANDHENYQITRKLRGDLLTVNGD